MRLLLLILTLLATTPAVKADFGGYFYADTRCGDGKLPYYEADDTKKKSLNKPNPPFQRQIALSIRPDEDSTYYSDWGCKDFKAHAGKGQCCCYNNAAEIRCVAKGFL